MKCFTTRTTVTLALGLGLTLALLYVLSINPRPVLADPSDLFVKTDGAGAACTQDTPCPLQTALTQAIGGDTIYVAQDTYTGTGAAVVTVTKSITLAGGWDGTPTGDVVRDPDAYPTTLDGEGQRRGVFIGGIITPIIDGFIVTDGNATGLGGASGGLDAGGGIYIENASPIIVSCVITNNVASAGTSDAYGGGIYLTGNSASAVISGNLIAHNAASLVDTGQGGGIAAPHSHRVTISNNSFKNNTAGIAANSMGGGIILKYTPALVSQNLFQGNQANSAGTGFGGGLYSQSGEITLDANTVISNAAKYGAVTFNNSTNITLTNNVIVQNRGGVFTRGNASNPLSGILVHNTIAQNGREGVYAGYYDKCCSTLILTNNIIVSHTIGIYAYPDPTNPNVVTATHTLFYDNITDTVGSTITSTAEITGSDPLFVDPAAWDYHILPSSPAIDAGTTVSWLTVDIDGDARPWPTDGAYDIGADEARWLPVHLPLILRNAP